MSIIAPEAVLIAPFKKLPLLNITTLHLTYPAVIPLLEPAVLGQNSDISEWLEIGVALAGT
ncbi:MAG TPA: hypothetical protein DD635_09375, partial [Flavobacteriales bacterium]|nr:hypothetical protein [Flavobacteriales bacterium]